MGNVTEYDPRRPRIPAKLGAAIDAARGQVSFNRWVVSRLADALGVELSEVMRAAAPKDPPKPKATKRAAPKAKAKPAVSNGRRALTSAEAKAGVLGRDKALAAVQQKHAARRASQRRDKS